MIAGNKKEGIAMLFALLLWLAAALIGATWAVPRCNHFQVGILFVLLTAVPLVAYIWRKSGFRRGADLAAAPER